jgi:hypothetical protein
MTFYRSLSLNINTLVVKIGLMTMLLYPYRIQVLIYTLINFLVSTVTRQEFHFILEKIALLHMSNSSTVASAQKLE